MKHLLLSKPVVGLVLMLLIAQVACVASSISPTAGPGTPSTSAVATQAPASGSQATQAIPNTGGQSTQAAPATGGQSTQAIPNTGGQVMQTPPADAQAMLNQVVQAYQSQGREQALQDFTNQTPPFNNSGLRIVCLGTDHKITAFSGLPALVGTSADTLTVGDGATLGNAVWAASGIAPHGSVPFNWTNPLTFEHNTETLFYQRLSQDICGVATTNNP